MYSGTDHVFEGRSLSELIDQLAKARPTASALSQSAAAYERISGELGQVQATLRGAMNQAGAAHQGAAADASQAHSVRQAAYADDATTESGAARGSVTSQSQQHADTMARMPQPAAEPNVWSGLTIPLDPSHGYISQVRDYAQRSQQAADAMNTYQGMTNDTVRKFAMFTEPTTAPVGLGEAGGAGNAGFPGGGGGPGSGVLPAGAGAGGVGAAGGASAQAAGTPGASGIPIVPQRVPPSASGGVAGRGSTPGGSAPRGSTTPRPGASSGTGGGTPGLTPLRPRPAVPGAWGGGGPAAGGSRSSGSTLGPGSRLGAGGAATGGAAEGSAARGAPAAGRAGTSGMPFMPMGAGAGGRRGDEERRRPSWLLEDDPEAAFGPMPPHLPPVIEATDDWDAR